MNKEEIIKEFRCKIHSDQKCEVCKDCGLYWKVKKALQAQKEEIKTQLQYAISDKKTLKRVENLPALK